MKQVWEVALSNAGNDRLMVMIPTALSRGLRERGYNRARVSVTDEGILVRPFAVEEGDGRRRGVVTDLPGWE